VELPETQLSEHLERFGQRLSIAAVNAPASLLVSGPTADLDALVQDLTSKQVFARRVRVDYASHCGQVSAIEEELKNALAGLEPRESGMAFYSCVTGARLDTTQLDADYWYRNLRQPVQFAAASQSLLADGYRFYIEASPHPTLVLPLRETLEASGVPVAIVGSLRRDQDGPACLLVSLGALHTRGLTVDWNAFFQPLRPHRIDLPTYAFQRERFWLDDLRPRGADVTSAGLSTADHPLLGAAVPLADSGGLVLTGRISVSSHPWLADHALFGRIIAPGSAFVELALAAAHHTGLDQVEDLTLETPLALPPEGSVTVQVTVGLPDETGRRPITLHARADDGTCDLPWTRHASGFLGPSAGPAPRGLRAWPPADAVPIPIEGLYARLRDVGLSYGPAFQGLQAVWKQNSELFAEVQLPAAVARDAGRFSLHPALLDAALQAAALDIADGSAPVEMPFSWTGISLHAVGAAMLRVRLARRPEDGTITLDFADAAGEPVGTVAAIATRPVSARQLRDGLAGRDHRHLLRINWAELPQAPSPVPAGNIALIGASDLWPALSDTTTSHEYHADLTSMIRALGQDSPPPSCVVIPCTSAEGRHGDVIAATARALALVQAWLADEQLAASRLVLLTRRAVATEPDEDVQDLAQAAIWGLVRTAQSEHPDRSICLIDTDGSDASQRALAAAARAGESQIALRGGRQLVPRLTRADSALAVPDCLTWRLDIPAPGTLDGLTLTAYPEVTAPLASGQVRVAVQAAGLGFRDVLNALDIYPGKAGPLGSEGAGIVTETGADVSDLTPGDRVMGLFPAAFGPVAVTDQRLLARIPAHWSFTTAAGIPVAFLTAYHCLVDRAHSQPGERVLVHAATGGVGMAAVQLARHLGAEVFATASPAKWDILRAHGFDDAHLASSRTTGFEQHYLDSTHGRGMDVILGSLTRELADAALRLLADGGRYIDIGKADIRDPATIAADHPGIAYHAFDLAHADPDRTGQILAELLALFENGAIHPLPTMPMDVRLAPRAFRMLAQAKHTGKLVLTLPRPLNPEGTVLITGGTGTLGKLVARHLVQEHAVRHLLLTSRHGPEAPGAQALRHELQAAGASVTITACDAGDRAATAALLATIASAHPLTAIVHAAGILDDAVFTALTPGQLSTVLQAKACAAWHLHELTQTLEVSAFVLFSSAAGVLGLPGEANYAAASTFLDALAHHRTARGQHALALDWGLWAVETGFAARLDQADRSRFARGGVRALTTHQCLALLDAALAQPQPTLTAARFDLTVLPAQTQSLPPVLRELAQSATHRRTATSTSTPATLKQRLLSLSPSDAERLMLDLVRAEAATVLGHASPKTLDTGQSLESMGLDSLMAVELKNRLSAAASLSLPVYLIREHSTVAKLAQAILEKSLLQLTSQGAGDDSVPVEADEDVYEQEIL
jgi:polyketide synthase 12